jgi:hypothetical protein
MTEIETIQQDTNVAQRGDEREREDASVERSAGDAPDGVETPSSDAPSTSDVHDAPPRVVPVAEAKKYRKRAQQAEQSLAELQDELEQKSQRVTELEQMVTDLERRSAIDQMLIEADAIDLESARLLTETAVQMMDEPDAAAAVEELRRTKPFLFRARAGATSAMSARIDASRGADETLDHAAAEAHATGDRNDLLRYLRLRRKRPNV